MFAQNEEVGQNETYVCVICQRCRKKHKGRFQQLHETYAHRTFDKIVVYATKSDIDTANRIQMCGNEENPVYYHATCKVTYVDEIKKMMTKNAQGQWHTTRQYYQSAFSIVVEYVAENVIEKNEVVSDKLARNIFEDCLIAKYQEDPSPKFQFIFNTEELDEKELLTKPALILRRYLRNCTYQKLGTNMNAADLLKGECELPQKVLCFMGIVLGSIRKKTRLSKETSRIANSITSNLVYTVTRGNVIPRKHIIVGSTIKSLSK